MTKIKEKKKMGLTTRIFAALLAGVVLGVVLCYFVPGGKIKNDIIIEGILYVIGQGFIRLMKMLVVPLVFCSLICGSMAIGDTKKLGTVGARTLIFYLATTAIAVTVAITVGNIINPGIGLDMSTISTGAQTVENMEATSFAETLLNIIPDNPFKSLASGEMLQVIVFALIVGVILAKLGDRADTVTNFFSQFNDVMMEMTMMVMNLAPIGVFCLIARTFANIGFSAFLPLAKYMIAVLVALALQCFGIYQILLKLFTGLNPFRFRLKRCIKRSAFQKRFRRSQSRLERPSIWMVPRSCRALLSCLRHRHSAFLCRLWIMLSWLVRRRLLPSVLPVYRASVLSL